MATAQGTTPSSRPRRWLAAALAETARPQPDMPWARGTARAEMHARRAAAAQPAPRRAAG
ncbi:hypothetical protein [Phaeovulum vinaykumarii]|uniref:Uncharacterized protein n=1 Tax=Phaeovulum vinaykumarii TaxID=407234 RepID=A0A1N7MF05_9RHOB|nr:hypothetical protein [Phaeovulum vinaykumarii]SIS84694.1 hypothetical protein SAMN05421795_10744 [Phaeovulum vinaykumarii]SOC11895.1 hypothetical protein SAMN05878426_10744 [Phaeovulum vinaykumarii]